MKHEALIAVKTHLISHEGMSSNTADQMLDALDVSDDDTVRVFCLQFWEARTSQPVLSESKSETSSSVKYEWPVTTTAGAESVDVGDGTNVKVEDLVLWLSTQKWSEFCLSLSKFYRDRSYLTDKQIAAAVRVLVKSASRHGMKPADLVSIAIEALSKPEDTYTPDGGSAGVDAAKSKSVPIGVYIMEGELYRVKANVAQSITVVDEVVVYTHEPDILPMLGHAGRRIDADTASNFGDLYGQCVFCGGVLADSSAMHGYDQACAKLYGTSFKDDRNTYWIVVTKYRPVALMHAVKSYMGLHAIDAKNLVASGRIGPFSATKIDEALTEFAPYVETMTLEAVETE